MMRLFKPLGTGIADVRLHGDRVMVRPPVERDWRVYAELRAGSRNFLEPWEPSWPPDALTRESFQRRLRRYAADWREDSGYSFFVFGSDGGVLLGGISLSNLRRGVAQCGTLGYWVGAAHARQGYMTETLALVLEFCFNQLGLHRVEAACLPDNEASQRLLRRAGFRKEGYARRYLKIRGQWHDHVMFALLGDEFARSERPQSRRNAPIAATGKRR